MIPDELIEYCLGKRHAYIDFPFGEQPVCIKVNGKLFAEIYTHDDNFKITLKCEPIIADFLRQHYFGIVVKGYHCPPALQRHRNTVYINKGVPDSKIFSMIDHSYAEVIKTFPRKVRREAFEEQPSGGKQ